MAVSSFFTNAFFGVRPVVVACGFAVFALFATAFVVPSAHTLMAKIISPGLGNVDQTTTASITNGGATSNGTVTKRYIVRRSVLQKNPESECRIYVSGKREGDC